MQDIIPPVDRALLEQELTPETFVKNTNSAENEIYIVNYFNAPNITREIGRLRELAFRDAGGGTGKDCDLDEFDTDPENLFQQLLVWDPKEKEIVGGYRFIHGKNLRKNPDGHVDTPTGELFAFSKKFIDQFLPHTIELGRSFIQPNYQISVNMRRGMFALDNIWNGLGAIIMQNPDVKYFFGKITMYPHFNREARDLILTFMTKYFGDKDNLVYPHVKMPLVHTAEYLNAFFTGGSYDEDYKILVKRVRECRENIPPLVNAYTSLSATMRYFGTAINHHFGEVEESGILVTIDDIYDIKKNRHIYG